MMDGYPDCDCDLCKRAREKYPDQNLPAVGWMTFGFYVLLAVVLCAVAYFTR